MLRRCFLVLFVFFFSDVDGQTIYKSWYSEESGRCIKIKDKECSSINEFGYLKIYQKDSILVIRRCRHRRALLSKKDVYYYKIEKLTNDSLILSQSIKMADRFEYMLDDKMSFVPVTEEACEDKWLEKAAEYNRKKKKTEPPR